MHTGQWVASLFLLLICLVLVSVVSGAPLSSVAGNGTSSKSVHLYSGLNIFYMSHTGEGKFIAWLSDSRGTRRSLADVDGQYTGTKGVSLPTEGIYAINTTADGSWAIDISLPSSESIKEQFRKVSGKGDAATSLYHLDSGVAHFDLTHAGSGDFIVSLLNAHGDLVGRILAAHGTYNGSATLRVPMPDQYLFDITADGPWTIQKSD